MKKLVLVALVGLLIGTAVFADHPDGLSLGGVLNFGWGQFVDDYYAGYINPGLSLKIPHVPVYWGFFGNIKRDSVGLGLTGDYYIFDKTIVDEDKTNEDGTYRLKLGWYLGVGLFTDVDFWDNSTAFNVGVRVPGGVSWFIIKKLELFVGIAPSIGAWIFENQNGLRWLINEEIGIRYWF
jgi:hypothetical protein